MNVECYEKIVGYLKKLRIQVHTRRRDRYTISSNIDGMMLGSSDDNQDDSWLSSPNVGCMSEFSQF